MHCGFLLNEQRGTGCRGLLPAVSGQFVSHGLRTFAYEGSLNIMKAVTGGAAELQVGRVQASSTLVVLPGSPEAFVGN